MSNSRPLTAQEQSRWKLFVAHVKILALQVEIAVRTQRQVVTIGKFAATNMVMMPPELIAEVAGDAKTLENIKLNTKKLGRIIGGVEQEKIGLSFPNGSSGDFDIVADPTATSDEVAYYQLSGIVILIAGAVILGGAIAYALYERGRTKKVIERHEATKSVADSKFCDDPNSDICARWMSFRQDQGYNDEQTFVDDLYDQVTNLQDALPSAVSTGVSWAIPVVALVAGLFLLGRSH